MMFQKEEEEETTTLYGFKVSSVGPSKVTGSDVVHVPTSMDLAMKLHYLRGVYYFNHSDTIQDLTITKIKESLFDLCNDFYVINGRLRRASLATPTDGLGSKEGRPYIKCNDCGVRFIEGKCSMSLNEWLDQLRACDDQITPPNGDFHKQLVPGQFIGPELGFSPLVFMQFISFKCGGMSIGLSFAHILGDIFSVSHFINLWGQLISGKNPTPKLDNMLKVDPEHPNTFNKEPDTIKRVEPVGDNWQVNNCKMVKHSFHITTAQIEQFQAKVQPDSHGPSVGTFEAICSFIWKQIAKIRQGPDVRKVTVCRNGYPVPSVYNMSNNQIISMVAANFEVNEASLKEVATLLADQTKDENKLIEQVVETDPGASDFIVYGANLTFADCTQAALYDLEFKGQKPVLVNYSVDSIGDNGLVLVLPAPPKDGGRIATVVLPENEMLLLKKEMRSNGGMVY